jgi:hypothetical protein
MVDAGKLPAICPGEHAIEALHTLAAHAASVGDRKAAQILQSTADLLTAALKLAPRPH